MLGLGEDDDELRSTLARIRDAGVEILTIGQYLQPTREHLPVRRWVHPDEFAALRDARARTRLHALRGGTPGPIELPRPRACSRAVLGAEMMTSGAHGKHHARS